MAISEYIALGIFLVYFLYKGAWLYKSFFLDLNKEDKAISSYRSVGPETFIMLGLCFLVFWLGWEFNF